MMIAAIAARTMLMMPMPMGWDGVGVVGSLVAVSDRTEVMRSMVVVCDGVDVVGSNVVVSDGAGVVGFNRYNHHFFNLPVWLGA